MYIKRDGSALISSMIILSVISLIGCMYYKMSNYNIELEALNYNHSDRYNMSKDEEEIIYKFMEQINENIHKSTTEGAVTEKTLSHIELPPVGKSTMTYYDETHRFILRYYDKHQIGQYRDIDYKISGNKVILIPSYLFEEKNFQCYY